MTLQSPIMAALAEILAEGRQRKGWSQSDLAFRAGVSVSTVSRLEQGRGKANVNSLRRLAASIGYDGEALLRLARNPDAAHSPAWLPEAAASGGAGGAPVSLAAIPGLFTADQLGRPGPPVRASEPIPRMRPAPHFGRVSAVRTERREEEAVDISQVPDVGIDFTVTVDGQCMEPRYEDGERVGCSIRRWEREGFVWNKDYWIRFKGGETTLKRVKRDPRDAEKIVCFPLNLKAKPFSRAKADVEKAARVLVVLSS
jgi:transcriptional regulator with XRE-family HTH domain